jgi:hypothetical protein
MEDKFSNIRSYFDCEIQPIFERIIASKEIIDKGSAVIPENIIADFKQNYKQITSREQFQARYMYPMLKNLLKIKCADISYSGTNQIIQPSIFMSNHRDIIIDSAFLQYVLLKNNLHTSEIAVGNNLVAEPWMLDIMKLNKSFVVYRNLNKREQATGFIELSTYIRHTICNKKESVWIAQRQGRAKDSNDLTQPSLLKMLALSGNTSFVENLKTLNITPLAISYEYDACDYLKAKEFQQIRDNPNFQKSTYDDIKSMQIGVLGYTGRLHYAFSSPINDDLDEIAKLQLQKKEEVTAISKLIDKRIHQNYKIFPNNYIALDKINESEQFRELYSENDVKKFDDYIENQISKIDLPDVDRHFCRLKIFEMYANPLKNNISTLTIPQTVA